MLRKIYKYPFPSQQETKIALPKGYQICDIAFQGHDLYLWALVDIDEPDVIANFLFVGTGWVVMDCPNLNFIKTIHAPAGLVWHVFEVNEANAQ